MRLHNDNDVSNERYRSVFSIEDERLDNESESEAYRRKAGVFARLWKESNAESQRVRMTIAEVLLQSSICITYFRPGGREIRRERRRKAMRWVYTRRHKLPTIKLMAPNLRIRIVPIGEDIQV